MKTEILNIIGDDWSNEVTNAVEKTITKLTEIPKMKKHIPFLQSIIVLTNPYDKGNEQYTLGSYTQQGVIKIYANKIKSIPQAIYVLLHEFSHHVAFKLAGLDSAYDSVKMNKAYFKEEIRADALAIMLMKKFFNTDGTFTAVIKEAKKRLDYMIQKFKGKPVNREINYQYLNHWTIEWDGWNDTKRDWSNLALAA